MSDSMTSVIEPPVAARGSPMLTVVVPCYNERPNVAPLIARLDAALHGVAWEAVYVDDNSPDGTAAEVRRIAQTDPRVRCIRRIGRRGLSSAVIEGALSSSAQYVAVIDGDLNTMRPNFPICSPHCAQVAMTSPSAAAMSRVAIRPGCPVTGAMLFRMAGSGWRSSSCRFA
jgi:hypothetical protein